MSEQRTNTLLTWGLRLVGWFVAFAGFTAMTNVIVTLSKFSVIAFIMDIFGVCV